MFSLHGGHSGEFCHHATGALEDLVRAAVARGMRVFGLTEHQPPATDASRYPDEVEAGLTAVGIQERFARYAGEVAPALRERYRDGIALLVGMETEVVPPDAYAGEVARLRERHALEYVVGSVHHVRGLGFDMSAAQYAATRDAVGGFEALCLAYFEAQRALLEAVRPEVVGHFDLVLKYAAPGEALSPAARRAALENLDVVRAQGALLEINARGLRARGAPYPLLDLLQEGQRRGIRATLGDDSHAPDQVGVGLDRCVALAAEAGYTALHYLVRAADGELRQVSAPLDELVRGAT